MAAPSVRTTSSPLALREQSAPCSSSGSSSGGARLDGAAQEEALQAAAASATPAKAPAARPKTPLRKGKWTPEEEMYANRIILYFNQGVLNIPAGTTLRSYLSERLNCDPMRITKKFAGASCIGKQVFSPCEQSAANAEEISRCEEELRRLEKIFLERLEQKNAVAFDLRMHTPSKDGEEKDSEWLKQGCQSAPRSSGRSRNGASAAIKKAISAPDLTQLAQMHEERKHVVPLGEEDPYTVDDKAAGDLLLEFFRKLHEDHAASVRAANAAIKEEQAEESADSQGTHARKQRKVGFDEESARKESTLQPQPGEAASEYESGAATSAAAHPEYATQETVRMHGVSRDRGSFQLVYPPAYGVHALKRRRSSEPALDKLVPVDATHPHWLSKLHSSHPLDEDSQNFHPPHRHIS